MRSSTSFSGFVAFILFLLEMAGWRVRWLPRWVGISGSDPGRVRPRSPPVAHISSQCPRPPSGGVCPGPRVFFHASPVASFLKGPLRSGTDQAAKGGLGPHMGNGFLGMVLLGWPAGNIPDALLRRPLQSQPCARGRSSLTSSGNLNLSRGRARVPAGSG